MTSCPICAEDYSIKSPGKVQSCCKTVLCQSCLYSHIKSILEEGITGEGRKKILCPFGCGVSLSDLATRESFQSQHWSFLRLLVGRSIYLALCCLSSVHPIFLEKAAFWWRLAMSPAERQDLQLYERWSLSVALSSTSDQQLDDDGKKKKDNGIEMDANHLYTHVIHCPRPDCECLWLVNKKYRKRKLDNERSYNNRNRHDEAPKGFTKSLLLSCSSYLFFKPLPPEKEEAIMNKNGYTTAHWMKPIDIDPFNLKSQKKGRFHNALHTDQEEGQKDGRLVCCPSCSHRFCGLCSRPWSTLSRSSGIRVSHTGKLCSIHGQRAMDDDDFLQAADAGDARLCPGCSMRTNRSDGCNHMTCPCGYHWCYVCESKFDRRHYACVEGGTSIGRQTQSSNCIIS
jgi:hypothetical protein